MTTINWQEMMANSASIGEPVPAGDYLGLIEESSFGKSSKGDPQWKITWRLIGGPNNNRRILDNFTLNSGTDEKAAQSRGFFFKHLKGLGFGDQFFAQMPEGEVLAQQLMGVQAMLSVTINDRGYNNVSAYQRADGAAAGMAQAPAAQPQGGFAPQQGFQQPQMQQGFQQPQQVAQPAAAAPGGFQQPQQPMQPQYQQPAAAQPAPYQQPQPGFQAPAQAGFQPQQQMPQNQVPAEHQYGQPQGLTQPMQPQGLMPPQQVAQQPVALGPDGQPLQQQNGQQAPAQQPQANYTPQPQPPF